jgi:hypothetical protein
MTVHLSTLSDAHLPPIKEPSKCLRISVVGVDNKKFAANDNAMYCKAPHAKCMYDATVFNSRYALPTMTLPIG